LHAWGAGATLRPIVRLLDRIAQAREPLLVEAGGEIMRLPGPPDFASAVATCPLRLILTDSLVHLCAALAYSDGDGLARCLDLIHVPATRLWVEWLDQPRQEAIAAAQLLAMPSVAPGAVRAGLYVAADPSGRRGTLHTFWGPSDGDGAVCLAPLRTEFDLDVIDEDPATLDSVFADGVARVEADTEPLASVLGRARFRFQGAWSDYYRTQCRSAAARASVLHASLATVATDLPVLLALSLLLNSPGALAERRVELGKLNRRRALAGRPALLDHVEVTAPVAAPWVRSPSAGGDPRRAPRLHHVRGHLVRRGNTVHWRIPHVRGRARLGAIRTRNLILHPGRPSLQRGGPGLGVIPLRPPHPDGANPSPGGPS
jgi:hypothetical protein